MVILNIALVAVGMVVIGMISWKRGFEEAYEVWMEDNSYEDGYEDGFRDGTGHEQMKFNELLSAIDEASSVAIPAKKASKKVAKKSK